MEYTNLFKEKRKNINNNIVFLLKYIFFIKTINFCVPLCLKEEPFLKNGVCNSTCTSEELKLEECKISNEIIKNQWLNNIIYFGQNCHRYINIETSEKNDLLAEVSCFPANNYRSFYGLTNEGKGFYSQKETLQLELNDWSNKGRFESEIMSFKLDDKIYLLSISKGDQYIEAYDFYNKESYFESIETIFGTLNNVHQVVSPHFKCKSNNYYFLGLLASNYNDMGVIDSHIFHLKKIEIHNLDIRNNHPYIHIENHISCSSSLIVSCFETISEYIICFYKDVNNEYTIIAYTKQLEKKSH